MSTLHQYVNKKWPENFETTCTLNMQQTVLKELLLWYPWFIQKSAYNLELSEQKYTDMHSKWQYRFKGPPKEGQNLNKGKIYFKTPCKKVQWSIRPGVPEQ